MIKKVKLKYNHFVVYLNKNEMFFWTFLNFGGSNFLRLASSLILTRIFLPEQFGLMAILVTLYVGVEQLSDVGIVASIIRHKDDKDAVFLKSAWTFSVIRGFILCIVLSLSSSFFANLFNAPIFQQYIPVFSLLFIIKGFKSTSMVLHEKHKKIKILTKLELSLQTITLITILILAKYFESLWVFIFGMLFSEILRTLSSYYILKGGVTGFLLDKVHVSNMIRFGKWLFLGTMFSFFATQGDRLLFGIYLTKEELGIYHVAATFAALPVMLHAALSSKIFFPTVCQKSESPQVEFKLVVNSLRKKIILLSLPVAFISAIFGQYIIALLYNDNYQTAGKILQILSIGAILQILGDSLWPILIAKGDSFRHMVFTAFRALVLIASIVLGNYFFQFDGILIALAVTPFLSVILLTIMVRKYVKIDNILSSIVAFIAFFVLTLIII